MFASHVRHDRSGVKSRTRQQVATAKDRAVRFIENVLQDPERADDVANESVEDYAERKRIQILDNPGRGFSTMKKDELQTLVDDIQDCLEDVYTPEASREELAEAVGKVLDMIDGGDEDEDEDEDEEEGDAAGN